MIGPPSPAALDAVHLALADGDAITALERLADVLGHPHHPDAQDVFVAAVTALARACGDTFPEAASAVARLAERPDDVDALYGAAYELIEAYLPAFAATLLWRAHAIAPAEERVLTEYVTALEQLGEYAAAARAVANPHPALRDRFMPRYLHAFEAGLGGDLQPARAMSRWLAERAADEAQAFMAERIDAWLARANALCGEGRQPAPDDLRGWHAVLFGGVVMRCAHAGDPADVGLGRFGVGTDDPSAVREAIALAGATLTALGRAPTRVFHLDERNSAILATAAATLWGVSLERWSSAVRGDGVIVAWDLRKLPSEQAGALREATPGQILWDHHCAWTVEARLTADLTTAVRQGLAPSWDDEEASVAQIAAAIAAADETPLDGDAAAASIAVARKLAGLAGPLRAGGVRPKRWPWGMGRA